MSRREITRASYASSLFALFANMVIVGLLIGWYVGDKISWVDSPKVQYAVLAVDENSRMIEGIFGGVRP